MRFPFIKLSKIENKFSYYEIKKELYKYDGSFIEINKNKKEVSIKVDIFSRVPFYYYVFKNQIYGNSSFLELVKELNNKKLPISYDNVSIAAFLKNNCFLENSTFFKEILRVPPGSKLIFNCQNGLINIDQYYKYEKKNYKETNENISAKYLDMLKQNFENYIDDYKLETIGISLTGGYDSRMILSVLDDIKIKPFAFHYGHKKSSDFKISKKLCETYGLNSKINEWKNLNYFKSNYIKILEESDFMLPLHHCHHHESILDQVDYVDTVFYGHFMDMQMQSHFYNNNFDSIKSQTEISKSLKNMWCGDPSAFSVLSMKMFKEFFSDEVIEGYNFKIDNMINKYSYLDSDKQYEISYLLNHGTRRAIKQCQLGSKKVDYYIPALQKNVFELIWNLETRIKKNRKLQEFIFKSIYNKAAKLDFVLDNYKVTNLNKSNFYRRNFEKIINILKNPKVKLLPSYFDFWGKEYHKFDNYKSWMSENILMNESVLDKNLINDNIFYLIKNNQNDLPFAFISSLFTLINFILFYKKLN